MNDEMRAAAIRYHENALIRLKAEQKVLEEDTQPLEVVEEA